MTATDGTVELGTVFHLLADEVRRDLLFALLEHDPQRERQGSGGVSLDDVGSERIQVELSHVHLPKLEDAGFVRWDRDTRQVHRGPMFGEIRPLLETLRENVSGISVEQPAEVSTTELTED